MKGLTIICKKTEGMAVSKGDNLRRKLENGDVKIKQVWKYNYLESVLNRRQKMWHRNSKSHLNRIRCFPLKV